MAKKRAKKKTTPKQASLHGMEGLKPAVKKRNTLKGREVRRELTARTAKAALGPIKKGSEIFCLTMGKFSLIDVLDHILDCTGPADVLISTWTVATADIGFAWKMIADGRIENLRFVIDYSFPSRQPGYCAALRERFGDDAIRITKNHAKIVLVTNKKWKVVVRTSMNLNECRMMETVEVSEHPGMAKWLLSVMDDLFENQSDSFSRTPSEHVNRFGEEWGNDEPNEMDANDLSFFGDGAVDVDLRRIGTTRRS